MNHPGQPLLTLGGVRIHRIVESQAPLLFPSEIFPDCTAQDIERDAPRLLPSLYDAASGKLVIAMQSYLVESEGRRILVDTCVGDCKARRRPEFDRKQWHWLDRLAEAGFSPEDIDFVVTTHLHVDHVGWHTRQMDGRWVPTFPRARYLFSRIEWDFWHSQAAGAHLDRTGDYLVDSLGPVSEHGLADLVDPDHMITSEVTLRSWPGHSPGHLAVHVRSEARGAVLAGDLLHHVMQCWHPQWSTRFCVDPQAARITRHRFLETYADTGVLILPAHFPTPAAGTLVREGGAYDFRFVDPAG